MATTLAAICPGCFRHKGGEVAICPQCGYDAAAPRSPLLLPALTRLNQRYLIGRTLGKPGGFGVAYLGFDLTLQVQVAVKEYCPRDLVGRDTSRRTLAPHSQEDGELFQVGLRAFLDEARTLAKFDHANVVRVRDFFEANGTAYLVMDYYEGESLLEYLERHGGKLPWRAALELMLPVLDGLREVHRRGFLHRDVKPHNIYLTTQGRPILLDFGSARQAMGERSRSLSVMLTEGYAPFEQYTRRGAQGPWTDIYGAAATLYLLITGQTPPPATERVRHDDLVPPSQLVPDLPQPLNAALLYGLATDPQQRPQTMEQFEQYLHGIAEGKSPVQVAPDQSHEPVKPEVKVIAEPKPVSSDYKQKKALLALAAAMGLIGAILLITQMNSKPESVNNPSQQLATTSANQIPVQMPQEIKPSEAEIQQWISNGNAYFSGEGVQQDYKQALYWFQKAAEQGNAAAQNYLGVMYDQGSGVPKDSTEAVRWYRKAAEQGYAVAQFNLGWMYDEGRGVHQDNVQAAYWYRKAADQGDANAQINLGVMYDQGRGVPKDDTEAVRWYRKSADQGLAQAQVNLGVMYANGRGVPQDSTEAARWYRKAAEQGNAVAQTNLGVRYAQGRGVLQDEAEAVRWYRKAADQGHTKAQVNLGVMYAQGSGVPQDEAEAVRWLRKKLYKN